MEQIQLITQTVLGNQQARENPPQQVVTSLHSLT